MAKKKSYEEIKNEIESKGVKLLSTQYINSLHPLSIRCKCGEEFKRSYKVFKKGVGLCDKCTEPIRRERGRSFSREEVEIIMNRYNLKLLTNFENITGVKMGLDVECDCGNKFRPTLYNLKRGESTRCWSCASKIEVAKRKRSIEEVKNIISHYGGKLLSEIYIDNKTDLKIRCECGQIHYRRLNSVLSYETAKCKLCRPKAPKGELKISEILKSNNVHFITQKTFDDCKLDGILRFDFYLPETKTVIEYDGIQHFEPVEFFGGEKEFQLITKRDEAKNEFCKSNNIKLIRINYKDFKSMESILVKNKIIPSQAS